MIRKYSAEEPKGEYCIVINAEGSKVEFEAMFEEGEAEEERILKEPEPVIEILKMSESSRA